MLIGVLKSIPLVREFARHRAGETRGPEQISIDSSGGPGASTGDIRLR
jgi:hypothetical protein